MAWKNELRRDMTVRRAQTCERFGALGLAQLRARLEEGGRDNVVCVSLAHEVGGRVREHLFAGFERDGGDAPAFDERELAPKLPPCAIAQDALERVARQLRDRRHR